MKILFLPDYSRDNPYQHLLVSGLRQNGVSVAIDNYTVGRPCLFGKARKHSDCDVIHIHWINDYVEWLFWSRSRIKAWLKLFFYIADIALIKIFLKKRIVWTIHNKFMHEAQDLHLERQFRRLLIRLVDRVLVHSNSAISQIKKSYSLKSTRHFCVIPHGHYINAYQNTIDRASARKRLNINDGCRVFLYFGLIRPYKGVLDLIDEFKKNNSLKDAVLLLAGKPFSSDIKKKISDAIKDTKNIRAFLSFVPDEDVQIFMNAADVAVFPFKEILMSSTVILAMSFGKPVIVPFKGSLLDLLDTRGAIFFNNDNSLRSALKEALNANLESMGAYNKTAVKKYNWESIGLRLKEAYQEII